MDADGARSDGPDPSTIKSTGDSEERIRRLEWRVTAIEQTLLGMGYTRPAGSHFEGAASAAASGPLPASSGPFADTSAARPAQTPASMPAFGPWATAAPGTPAPRTRTQLTKAVDWLAAGGPGRVLALVGGGALLLGMAFFLSLAFNRGWIGPEARVAMGLVAGAALLALGGWLFDRARPTLGHVLVGVGLATIELALFASRLYELVPPEVAMGTALVAALAAGYLAVRFNSQLVAGMGIAAVLAAPPIVGAPPSLVTVAFLGAVLVGVAYVSLVKAWDWLPWLSFGLTAPQLLGWVTQRPDAATEVIVLGAYWALFAASAVGPALRHPHRPIVAGTALLGINAAFVTAAAFVGISDTMIVGGLVGALAAANLATGVGLARTRGLHDDLAQAALGLSTALAVAALALLLDGNGVVVAWTLIMAACAWVWLRLGIERAAVAVIGVGALTALQILSQYVRAADPFAQSIVHHEIPYATPEAVGLGAFLLGLTAIGLMTRNRLIRQVLVAAGISLVALTIQYESRRLPSGFEPPMIVIGLTALGVLAVLVDRFWYSSWTGERAEPPVLPFLGAVLGLFAVSYLIHEMDLLTAYVAATPPGEPFAYMTVPLTAAVIAGLMAVAASRKVAVERYVLFCLAALMVVALLYHEEPLEWAVAGWSMLGVAFIVLPAPTGVGVRSRLAMIGFLGAIAALAIIAGVAPITRLAVHLMIGPYAAAVGSGPPNGATVALAALAIAGAVFAWHEWRTFNRNVLALLVLVPLVYMVSIGLVDFLAAHTTQLGTWADVYKEAQVALTITWAAIGLGLLVAGLVRDIAGARYAGLTLLGIATVKAFLFDLTALDVAYRVLSLVGLGVLLLAGAYGYQRMRHGPPPGRERLNP